MSNEEKSLQNPQKRQPGVCVSWEEAKERFGGEIQGNEEQIKRVWQTNDAEAYDYFWQCLLSF